MPTRRIALVTALALAGAVTLLLSWPQIVGAQRLFGVAQLISFRPMLMIGFGVLALLVGMVTLFRRRLKPALALGLTLILSAGAVANGAALMARGSASGAVPDGDLIVMAWNTQGGATSPAEIARVAAEVGADVVSLPETDEKAAAEVAHLLLEQGISMSAHTVRAEGSYNWIPTSVLITDSLGAYELARDKGTTPGLPSGVWQPVDGAGPIIIATHPLPPLPDSMDGWDAGLRWIAAVCTTSGPNVVVAGDFNATVDHMAGLGKDGHLIGRCDDAALETSGAAAGTWPSDAPAWISSPIDHVLFGAAWTALSVRVLDGDPGGSDHKPIVAVLDRR